MEANQLLHGTVAEEIQVSCRTHSTTPDRLGLLEQQGQCIWEGISRWGRNRSNISTWSSCCNDPEKRTKRSEGSAARAGRNARWCRKSREGWRRAAVGSPFGTVTHRYGTLQQEAAARLCVPAVCCWKPPDLLRLGEWQRRCSNVCAGRAQGRVSVTAVLVLSRQMPSRAHHSQDVLTRVRQRLHTREGTAAGRSRRHSECESCKKSCLPVCIEKHTNGPKGTGWP